MTLSLKILWAVKILLALRKASEAGACTLTNSGKYRISTVLGCDIVDQLLNQNGLSYTCSSEQTGLTASVWKLPNKGLIRDGFDADFILFDETKLRDCADFKDGTQIAEGIVSVYIGGELVYDGKNITEARPGKCLL